MSRITEIATIVAAEALKKKNPFSDLEWCRDYSFSNRFRTTQDENFLIYFAAINILKNQGIQKTQRKPLSDLTAKEKLWMRKKAKWLAEQMTPLLDGATVIVVPSTPIKGDGDSAEIMLSADYDGSSCLHYTTFGQLKELKKMSVLNQKIAIQKAADGCKTREQKMSESIELFRATLSDRHE